MQSPLQSHNHHSTRQKIMGEEMSNFIMVWSQILMLSCYCYGIRKLVPKGAIRFFTFLPVVCIFFLLPFNLTSVNLIVTTFFFVTWLATFKLLLLAFGSGPLSDTSLSLPHFVLLSCLPICVEKNTNPKSHAKPLKKSKERDCLKTYPPDDRMYVTLSSLIKKGFLLIFLIKLGYHKDMFSRDVVLLLTCMVIYMGLEVMLGVMAIMGQFCLGVTIESPFLQPYLATSLNDFWGYRWNRISSNILRSAVYDPVRYYMSQILGHKRANDFGLVMSFIVSDLMHEIMFYYLGRTKPGWGTPVFFFSQGICIMIERSVHTKINGSWQLPRMVIGPTIFGFVVCLFMWLALPEVLEHNVLEKALAEYAAVAQFVQDLGLTWSKMGYNLLVQNLKSTEL